ncbi:AaceriABL182Cp [[Ashbya] aceris (nom. inval.)]|nr:AaceriABL182Cp [[Ashbya] aceris (nom. inval.)]
MSSVPIPTTVVNWDILNEVVSMDEDDPGFSQSLFVQYFDQADTTFQQIQRELESEAPELATLSSLGHFLKGSSASLGLQRVAWACERIQNYGKRGEGAASSQEPDAHYVQLITDTLQLARAEVQAARKELSEYYHTEL